MPIDKRLASAPCAGTSPASYGLVKEDVSAPYRLARVSRESAWIIGGQSAALIGQLIAVRALTTSLSPEEYGRFALALAAAGLVTQTAMAPSQGVVRFYSLAAERGELNGWSAASIRLMARATIGVVGVGILIGVVLSLCGHGDWVPIAAVCVGYCLISGWGNAASGVQVAARRRRVVAIHQGAESLLRGLFALALMPLLGALGTTAALAYLLASFVTTASLATRLRRLLPSAQLSDTVDSGGEWRRKIWQFSWPFAVWGVFTWMQQASDRYAISWFDDISQVGMYAVLFQIGYTPVTFLSGALVSLIFPVVYQRVGDATDRTRVMHSRRLLLNLLGCSLATTVFAVATVTLLHREIFAACAGPQFREYSHLLPWVVLAGGLFSAGQIVSLRLISENRTKSLMWIKLVTASVGIALNLLGAFFAGAIGVVSALVMFAFMFLLCLLWRVRSDNLYAIGTPGRYAAK